ncbi:hypothetical protein [Cohnella soli]|uniref:Mannosidase Ig/CBM-like domain-containing protein n=1 Tax=Cohnella soli TaxID=425005 RepID=A0ABW0HWZ8_9BACL
MLLTVDHEVGHQMTVYMVNDTLSALDDIVSIEICDFSGNVLYEAKCPVRVEANSVMQITEISEEALNGRPANEVVLHVHSESAYSRAPTCKSRSIRTTSEIQCSDNFFDMMPNTTIRIKVKHLSGHAIPFESLRVSTV